MKNVQIIDGAENCTYSVYAFTEKQFTAIFPSPGQNVEFIEDAIERLGDAALGKLLKPVWNREVPKKKVRGIDGTLFYELTFKKKYYPTKREEEMINPFK